VLVGRLVDDDAAVRFAAREALGHLGVGAWPALTATAASGPDPLSVEALCLADELGAPAVPPLLRDLSAALLGRAERAARLEARLMAHPQLDLLTQVAGEERHRLARLALRAFGQVADPAARDIAERALDSRTRRTAPAAANSSGTRSAAAASDSPGCSSPASPARSRGPLAEHWPPPCLPSRRWRGRWRPT
jgi:hypothetical protein